jgi:uncharacterized protein (TIRG00374 family)
MGVQKNLSSIAIYSITFLVLIAIILFVQPENLINKLFGLGLWGILLLVLLYSFDLCVRAYRWKILLIAQGVHLSVKSLIGPVVSALAINLFTIARAGETARLYALKRNHNTTFSDTLSSIVIEQILSIIGLLVVISCSLFLLTSSFYQIENSELIQQLVIILFFISTCVLLVLGLMMIKPEFTKRLIGIFPPSIEKRVSSAYEAFLLGLTDLRSKPLLLIQGLVTSVFIWVIEGIMLYVIAFSVFPAFEIIDLPWSIAASCIGNITFIIPLLPGAMGQYEVVVALILINSPNYPPGTYAALVALIDRVAKSIILGFFGGYAILRLGGKELLQMRKDQSSTSDSTNRREISTNTENVNESLIDDEDANQAITKE